MFLQVRGGDISAFQGLESWPPGPAGRVLKRPRLCYVAVSLSKMPDTLLIDATGAAAGFLSWVSGSLGLDRGWDVVIVGSDPPKRKGEISKKEKPRKSGVLRA